HSPEPSWPPKTRGRVVLRSYVSWAPGVGAAPMAALASELVLVGDLVLAAARMSGAGRSSEPDSGLGTVWGQGGEDLQMWRGELWLLAGRYPPVPLPSKRRS